MRPKAYARTLRALLAAALLVSALPALSAAQTPGTGPVNQAPPAITRSADTLSTDSGRWVGAESFIYDWMRCTGTVPPSCGAPVTGAIQPSYELAPADAGRYLRVRVTASNASGSSSSLSAPFGPIEQAPRPRLLRPFPVVVVIGREQGTNSTITNLTVRGPQGATVRARCLNRGCAFRSASKRIGSARKLRLRAAEGAYRAGAVIEIRVLASERIGKFTRIRIRSDRLPARMDSCLEPGARRPSRCPSSP